MTGLKKRTRRQISQRLEWLEDRCVLATLTWVGDLSTNWNDINLGNTNWSSNALPGNGDTLIFAGVGIGTLNNDTVANRTYNLEFTAGGYTINGNAITLNGGVDISSSTGTNAVNVALTLNASTSIDVGGGLLTLGGVLSGGAGSLTKTGNADLALTNTNTYGGTTTVSAGDLSISGSINSSATLAVNGGTLSTSGADKLANGAAVTVAGGTLTIGGNDTVGSVTLTSGSITGTGNVLTSGTAFDVRSGSIGAILGGGVGLTKSTGGTVTLSSVSTYSGTTTVSAGSLSVTGSINSSATVQVNGGTLSTNGADKLANGAAVTVAGGTLTIGGNDTVGSVTLTSGSITGTGNVLTSGTAFDVRSGSISAILGGGVGLAKSTGGTVTLSSVSTYSGTTTVSAGSLSVTGSINSSATVQVNGGTLSTSGADKLANTAAVTVGGGTLTIGGNDSVASVTLTSGSITGTGNVLTSGATFNVQSGSISANLGGGVGLTKSTGGTVTLSGVNTYSGATTVSGGTLDLVNTTTNNNISSSPTIDVQTGAILNVTGLDSGSTDTLILASGQTLKGTGTVTGRLVAANGSFVSPGASPGIINTGDVTFNTGGTYTVEVNGVTTAGTDYDQLNVTGTVTLVNATLALSGTHVPSITTLQSVTIINNDGGDLVSGTFNNLPEGAPISLNGRFFYITYAGGSGNDVVLNSQPIVNGTTGNDTLSLRRNAGNTAFEFSLNGGAYVSLGTPEPERFTFNGNNGDDVFTLDYVNGNAIPGTGGAGQGIFFNGQGQTTSPLGDKLVIQGTGTQAATYLPSATTNGDGTVTVTGDGVVTFTGLEPVDMIGLATATLTFPNADEVLTIANGTTFVGGLAATRVSGTSGGVGFETVALRNVTNIVIDTTTSDGSDSITITSANNAHGNGSLSITTGGAGTDVITWNGSVAIDGNFTLSGLERVVLGASVSLDTEQGNNSNGGNVTFGGAPISANSVGRDLTINTATTGGVGGSVTLPVFNNTGGQYVNDLTLDTNGSTDGTITLTGNISLDNGGDAADVTVTTGTSIQLTTTLTIDTEQGDNAAGGLVNFGTSALSGTVAGVDLTITTNGTAAGAVTLAGANNAGGQFLNDLTISAVTGGTTGALVTLGGAAITLATAGDLGDFNITSGSITDSVNVTTTGVVNWSAFDAVAVDAAVNSGVSTITIQANQDGAGAQSFTMGAGGSLTTTNDTATAVVITVNTGGGGTGDASIRSISAGTTSGAAGGRVTITTNAGDIVDGDASATNNITAGNVLFLATSGTGGAGTAANPVETTASRLEAQVATGGVFVANTGNLTIGGISGTAGVSATGLDIVVSTSNGSFTVAENVSNTGAGGGDDVTLTANDIAGAGQDLTVNSGITVSSSNGDVTLQAGDVLTLTSTSVVQANNGDVTLTSNFGAADTTGSQALDGTITANNTTGVVTIDLGTGSGNAVQASTGTITGDDLRLLSATNGGSFNLSNSTTNNVDDFAANTSGTIDYTNVDSLTIATVSGTIGVTTTDDDVRLVVTTGSFTINQTINLGVGDLDLVATTGATQTVGANILANSLLLRGTGAAINTNFFNLSNATNNVATIAANLSNGAVRYFDADALSVGISSVTTLAGTTTATGITVGNPASVAPAGGDVFLRAGQTVTTGLLTVTQIIDTNSGTMGNLTLGGGVVFSGAGNTNVGSGDIDLEGGAAVPDIVIDNPTTHNMTGGTVTYRPDRDIFINQPVFVNNGHLILDADGEDPVVATTIAQVQVNLGTGNGVGGVWIRNAGSLDVNTGAQGGGSLVITGSQINNTPNGAAGYGGLVADAGVQIDTGRTVTAATTISALVKTAGATGNDMQIDGNIIGDAGGAINVQVEDTFTLNSTLSLTTEGNITIDAEDMVIGGAAVIDAQEAVSGNGTGIVWLRNRTFNREIDLGGALPVIPGGRLSLTNAELNRISLAQVVRIGRNGNSTVNAAAGAGTITISVPDLDLSQNTVLHLITSDDIVDGGSGGINGLGSIIEDDVALEANTGIDLHNFDATASTGNDFDNLAILVTGGDAVIKDRDEVNFRIVDDIAATTVYAVSVSSDLTMIMGGNLTQTDAVAAGGLELIDLFNGAPPPTFLANPTYYLPHSSNTIGQLEAYSQQSVNITNSTTLTVGTVANSYLLFPATGSNGVWVSSLQLTAPTVVVNSPIETNEELGFVTFDVTTLLDINANIFSRGKIEQIGTGVVTVADVELRTTDDNITFLGGVTLDGASLTTPTLMSTDAGWTTPFTGIPLAVDAAAQTGAGSVIFNSTLRSNPSGDTAVAYRGNDLTLETGTGNIQFIGQVGGASGAAGRLGVVNIVDAHDVTASTGFSANAIYQQAGDGETRFNGFVQTNGRRDVLTPAAGTNFGVDITTKMITLNAAMQTTSAPGSGAAAAIRLNNSGTMSIVAGAGSINSDGAVSQVGTGNNLVGGDIVTTNDNISFLSDTYLSGSPLQINSGNADVSFAARFQINNKTVTIRDQNFVELGTVTAIAGGILNVFVGNTATRGSIQAGSGETITGAGTLNTDVSVLTGGTLAPAMDASGLGTGILTINGNVVLGTNAVYAVDLNGTSAGASYDQVVTGATFTFTATGAILSATRPVTFNPATGSVLRIIDGSVNVIGDFSNAANGTFVYINGLYFRVDYDVTAGDLTLTRQDPPGAVVTIIDDNGSSPNTSVTGFTLSPNTTAAWSPNSVAGRGYGNDLRFAAAGNGSSTALYTFNGLIAGHTYRVSTTWYAHINRATDSPFTVDDGAGGTAAVTTTINQRNNPNDFTSGGSAWEDLVVGGYTITGTTLTVLLTNNTSTGYVIADAVRIEDITGAAPEIVVMDGTTDIPDGTGVVDFGTTSTLGADISKVISIKNTGLSPLVLSSATITPPAGFTISGYTPQTILPGMSGIPFTITLSHSVAGNYSGQILFNTNDFDENPFNFTVKGGVTSGLTQIADNLAQGGGYNTITGSANNAGTNLMYGEVGPWHNNDDSLVGYQQDLRYAAANSNAQATWTFSGLAAGTYRVSVTYRAEPNRASNASFTVIGTGVVNPTTVSINQRVAPNQFQDANVYWIDLDGAFGTVSAGGTITVTLDALGSNGFVIADAVRVEFLHALQAEDGPALNPTATVLTTADLDTTAAAAVARWQQAGLTAAQQAALNGIVFGIVDLPNGYLGGETDATIFVDANAAGYGWYVDATPADDAEFGLTIAGTELRATDPLAADHMDLLTVLMHEIGHRLGLDDVSLSEDAHGLMAESLDVGTRRLPVGIAVSEGNIGVVDVSSDTSDTVADDVQDELFITLGATETSVPSTSVPTIMIGGSSGGSQGNHQGSGHSNGSTPAGHRHHRTGGKPHQETNESRSLLGTLFSFVRKRR